MNQKTILLARAAMMLLVMVLSAASAWAWTGSGTSDVPYQIANKTDLETLRNNVNGGTNYDNVYFKQTADITLSGAWTPIGTDSNPFKGHYDGGGFTISGLTVTGNYQYAGLFGYITSDYDKGFRIPTELKNINIVNCNIDVSSAGSGNGKAGGIAGYVNCFNMSNCKVSGTIKGYNYAAGLIGQAGSFCTMNGSFADVTVDAHKADPNAQYPPAYCLIGQYSNNMSASGNYYHDKGGVPVGNKSEIIDSATPLYMVTGAPSGVTVAATNATLTYNAKHYFAAGSTATLTVDDANKIFRTFSVSGGATYNVAANKKSATVTLGSSDATVTATLKTIGGSCGTNATWVVTDTDSNGTYETLTISGSGAISSSPWATDFAATITRVNISSADLTISDNPFSTLGGSAVIVVPTPAYALGYSSAAFASKLRVALRSYLFSVTNEGGTPAYAITGETDLRNLAAVINGNTDASTAITGQGMTFRQTANIAFGNQTFTPIGAQGTHYKWFAGTYDGGGYTISGLTVSTDKQHAGLFGRLFSATIKNVVLVSPTVTSNYNGDYDFAEVGALAGRMDGGSKTENCLVINPTVSASNSKKRVGAIVGNLYYKTDRLTNTLFYSTTDYGLYGDRHVLSTITNSGRARKVTLGSGVSIESPAASSLEYGFVYEAETYYREGVTLTLTGSPTGYSPIYSANGTALGGNTYSVNSTDGDVTLTVELTENVMVLADATDNTDIIADATASGKTYNRVTITGRTLYKDGDWNTLCLPFAVSTTSGPLAGDGVVAMTLNTTTSGLSGTTLTLNFTEATTIPAGTPFIIKWGEPKGETGYLGTTIENPVFTGVTIDKTMHNADFTGGTFKGTYSPIVWDTENKSILFVGTNNTLYWPTSGGHVNACRAYFDLGTYTAREFVLNFDDQTTGVKEVNEVKDDSWYTLNGVKLSGKPTKSGLYIHGNRKVVIK